jgi:site-specific DNA recombinase
VAPTLRTTRTSTVAAVVPAVRCAIYTRVSTEDQAAKDFSSLDAQREAAAAYVLSQRAEGWVAVPDRYDDAGISGATLERPAVKRLLADVEAGRIDCIVVYKFDRLSRSMLDFLQLLDLFKKKNVSFVSVSQRFDTSTPVGEMTLNILLSFAQFERQIIAERTRDKIHAARRRGRWTGGQPILGYDTPDGKLLVNRDEAEQVKTIFDLYLEHRSLLAVVTELNRRGWRRKSWTTKTGHARVRTAWDKANLLVVLRNPLYAGMQKLARETFKGDHPAIVTKDVFRRVQAILDGNGRTRGAGSRNRHGALLRGLLHCASCGTAMVHTWTRRRAKAFRYYRCSSTIKGGASACPTRSVAASRIEEFVLAQIRRVGADLALRDEVFRQVQQQVAAERRGIRAEAKRADRDAAQIRAEVGRLARALATADPIAAPAFVAALGEAQDRLGALEARQQEIGEREAALATTDVSPETIGRMLEQFEPLWEVLTAPERERVVGLLVERVDYDGAAGEMEITFRAAGVVTLAGELEVAS